MTMPRPLQLWRRRAWSLRPMSVLTWALTLALGSHIAGDVADGFHSLAVGGELEFIRAQLLETPLLAIVVWLVIRALRRNA